MPWQHAGPDQMDRLLQADDVMIFLVQCCITIHPTVILIFQSGHNWLTDQPTFPVSIFLDAFCSSFPENKNPKLCLTGCEQVLCLLCRATGPSCCLPSVNNTVNRCFILAGQDYYFLPSGINFLWK